MVPMFLSSNLSSAELFGECEAHRVHWKFSKGDLKRQLLLVGRVVTFNSRGRLFYMGKCR